MDYRSRLGVVSLVRRDFEGAVALGRRKQTPPYGGTVQMTRASSVKIAWTGPTEHCSPP
jgi:hypothetical protein